MHAGGGERKVGDERSKPSSLVQADLCLPSHFMQMELCECVCVCVCVCVCEEGKPKGHHNYVYTQCHAE